MRFAVIGAQGSIGQRVVKYLREQGHELITVSTRPSPSNKDSQTHHIQIEARVSSFDSLFAEHEIDCCINASGSPTVGFSFEQPLLDRYLNYDIPRMLADAILSRQTSVRLINFSSAAVYGNPSQLPISESTPIAPISPYGKNKAEAESYLLNAKDQGLQSVCFRIFSAYGPGLRKQLFWDLAAKCSRPEPIVLHGTGRESRDFISMDDIAIICECYAMRGLFEGQAINICSGVETSIKHVSELFAAAFNRSEDEFSFNGVVREGDPVNWRGDLQALCHQIDFQPQALSAGIAAYAEWYKSLKV